jgi:hypothetical protein
MTPTNDPTTTDEELTPKVSYPVDLILSGVSQLHVYLGSDHEDPHSIPQWVRTAAGPPDASPLRTYWLDKVQRWLATYVMDVDYFLDPTCGDLGYGADTRTFVLEDFVHPTPQDPRVRLKVVAVLDATRHPALALMLFRLVEAVLCGKRPNLDPDLFEAGFRATCDGLAAGQEGVPEYKEDASDS